ncbi:biotin-dependent carboxyltransferase family protein [Marinospirillum sp.]|uniref:5-oxoprolinase subunit C family protein n=1 Tax=Marinospirillum sp. TaxID=2183934 RepID=UPI00384B1FF1
MSVSQKMPVLEVLQAGPWASLQDAGRFGVRPLGITQGGPADLHAWAWANRLLGNPWNTASVEILLGGLQLEFTGKAWACITGADLGATLDGEPLQLWQPFQLHRGQRLAFATPRQGIRAYLAVAGGFPGLKPVLGSLACVVRERLGGHQGQGQLLQVGDQLPLPGSASSPPARRQHLVVPDYKQTPDLALIPGAQIRHFSGRSLFQAFNTPWQVDQRADRMGVRLTGPRLECQQPKLISEGIALGGVQVPADGQPFVLLNDRQTIGGYPRLGTLTPLACSRLAQCAPGSKVLFRAQGLDQAQREYRSFLQNC